MRDEAVALAKRHKLHLFPVNKDKTPATAHGFKDASNDPDAVASLFRKGERIGLWPGASNLVVVDIDVKDGANGEDEWRHLTGGQLEDTAQVITPSGGRHLYFRKPEGLEFDNTKLSGSIDIRSDNGYVILPSPDSGYEWELGYDRWCKRCGYEHHELEGLPYFPETLIRELREQKVKAKEPVNAEEPIPSGARYDTLFRLGRKMRFNGMPESAIREALLATNRERCQPPHPDSYVINHILKSVMNPSDPPVNPETGEVRPEQGAVRLRKVEETGFEPVDWTDVWDKPFPDIDWVPEMEGIAISGRASNIYGPAGVGKSELILNRAVAAAKEGVRVLWLDREMTELDTLVRLKEMGYSSTDVENFIYLVYPPFHMFDTPAGGEELEGVAKLHDAEVIILDSLSKFVSDEEGTSHGYFYVNTVLPLRSQGRALVVIDHAGKDLSRGARGASQKKDNMDLFMECARYVNVGTKLTTAKRRHSWVKDSYTYRRLTNPVLEYKLSNVCVFCKAPATTVGGPTNKPVCDAHSGR